MTPMNDRVRDRLTAAALAVAAALLAVVVLWTRAPDNATLEAMARASIPLDQALVNGRPTVVEFYANWCEVCHGMAPAMAELERTYRRQLDVVLLNVDNPMWEEEIQRYGVRGLPTLLLLDAQGRQRGESLGGRQPQELEAIFKALANGTPLPAMVGVGAVSDLPLPQRNPAQTSTPAAAPRSHG